MTSDALMLGFPNVLDWFSENIKEGIGNMKLTK